MEMTKTDSHDPFCSYEEMGDDLKKILIQNSDSPSTIRNRRHFWQKFEAWCKETSHPALPTKSDTLVLYLFDQARKGAKKSTLNNMRWAIDSRHRKEDMPAPSDNLEARLQIKGLLRELASKRPDQVKKSKKKPITIEHIKKMNFPDGIEGIRDRTLLLVGFSSGMRRSELASLERTSIRPSEFGLRIEIPRSKSDQSGKGEVIDIVRAIDYSNHGFCPVDNLEKLLGLHNHKRVFTRIKRKSKKNEGLNQFTKEFTDTNLDGNLIYRLIKKYGVQIGFKEHEIGAHSLRSGCATYLLEKAVPAAIVQKQLRHKSFDTTQSYNHVENARLIKGVY